MLRVVLCCLWRGDEARREGRIEREGKRRRERERYRDCVGWEIEIWDIEFGVDLT